MDVSHPVARISALFQLPPGSKDKQQVHNYDEEPEGHHYIHNGADQGQDEAVPDAFPAVCNGRVCVVVAPPIVNGGADNCITCSAWAAHAVNAMK